LRKLFLIFCLCSSLADAQALKDINEVITQCREAIKKGDVNSILFNASKLVGIELPDDEKVIEVAGICLLMSTRLNSASDTSRASSILRSIDGHKRPLKGLCYSLFEFAPRVALSNSLCRALVFD
jgi:hypothetical protein